MNGWNNANFCVNCHEWLSYGTMMHSHGRCPCCGFKHPRACTIVMCYDRAWRWVRTYPEAPWWQFWKSLSRTREWAPKEIE